MGRGSDRVEGAECLGGVTHDAGEGGGLGQAADAGVSDESE